MSRISSKVDAVEQLSFSELPSRKKVAITAAVRVNKATIFLGANGDVYSTQVKQRCFYTLSSGLDDTLAGCELLGLLSKEAVEKHKADVSGAEMKRCRRYAAESLIDSVETLGIKLTAAQEKILRAAGAHVGTGMSAKSNAAS